MLNKLESDVYRTVKQYNMFSENDRVLVALSGGADSCALVYALKSLCDILNIKIGCAHLNHGIRGDEALRDMNSAKKIAEKLSIPFHCKTVDVPKYSAENSVSEETAGRILRYDFFNALCKAHGYSKIAVAHNKNDSCETIIMNLLRGCGSNGLKGILPVNGTVVRPVIECTRSDIEAYCREKNIDYVTDSTNNDDIYTRNFVRLNIIPRLEQVNLNAVGNIIKCSETVASESDFIEKYIDKMQFVDYHNNCVLINRTVFESEHPAIKRRAVISAVTHLENSTNGISSARIDALCICGQTGKNFYLTDKIRAYVGHDFIEIKNNSHTIPPYEYTCSIPGIIDVIETGTKYTFEICENNREYSRQKECVYLNYDVFSGEKITLRTRRNGDVFSPSGMNGRKKVKKFFIDSKIPEPRRNLYPIMVINNDIAAILPLRIDNKYLADSKAKKILKITITGGTNEQ